MTQKYPDPTQMRFKLHGVGVFLVSMVIFSTGCSAIKGALRPMVCDCGEPAKNASCPPPSESDGHEEDEGYVEAGDNADIEASENDDNPDAPTSVAQTNASEPGDAGVLDDAAFALTEENVAQVRNDFVVRGELTSNHRAFVGRFSKKGQRELAVFSPGESVAVYSDRAMIATGPLPGDLSLTSRIDFLSDATGVFNVVGDDSLELFAQEVRIESDGTRRTVFSVYKVFGRGVGRIFEQEIGVERSGQFVPTYTLRVLKGDGSRWFEVTSSDGAPPAVYRWNHWEGMFRIPKGAPTAPKRDES